MPKKISKYYIFSYNCVQSGFNPLISYNKNRRLLGTAVSYSINVSENNGETD